MIRHRARNRRPSIAVESLELRTLMATVASATSATVNLTSTSSNSGAMDLQSFFVRFSAAASMGQEQAAIKAVGGSVATSYPDGLILVDVAPTASVTAAIARIKASSLVTYTLPNSLIHDAVATVYPNDPGFPSEYALNNVNNVDIDAPQAWGVTTGSSSVIVAVLDTGLDFTNPDFAYHLWTNPTNDAAAGYPNDIHGWNFVSNTNDVEDDNGHGTHVTSLLAAAGNNGTGIAGVAWNVQIMPVKFLDSNGDGTTAGAVDAIYYAVNHGARVINASWGGISYTQPLADAIAYANAHNVVFVTAAGNNGTNNDVTPSYPASIRLPNTLSVAAVDGNGQLASFSNYGASTVDIAAPGVNILGDYPSSLASNELQFLSGTSMSTAFVSGVAALVASMYPSDTAAQIVQRIDATAKPLLSLAGKVISGGMVDAYHALISSDQETQAAILASSEFSSNHGSTPQGFVTGLYLDLLDRSPDPGGLAYWSNLIQSGAATRQQIATAILDSPEAATTQVAEWYQSDLGRTASIAALKLDSGVNYWATLLEAGQTNETVESYLLASPEYLKGHGGTPTSEVDGWYETVLGRAADSAGAAAWINALQQGVAPLTVIEALDTTAEARATKVARWYTSYLGRTTGLAALKVDSGVLGYAAMLPPS